MALPGTLLRIWQRLIEPPASVRVPTARFQARATSSILVLILALGAIQVALRFDRPPFPPPLFAILFIAAASYPLSRTRYYRLAGMITIAALWLLPLLTIINAPVITLSFIFVILRLILLSVLTTYVLFSLPISLLFGLIIFISFLMTPPTTIMRAPAMHLAGDFGFNGLGVFAVFLIARQFDLNARRISEQALNASEERYRAIVKSQSELICRWLPDTTLTFVNDAYCQFFSKTRAELIGTRFADFLFPDDRQIIWESVTAISPDNPTTTNEHRVRDAAGDLKWHQWRDSGLFDDQGRIIEFQSVGRDITERKAAEAALRASEERYRVIVEAQSEMISRWLPDTTLTFVNDAYCRYIGQSREELIGAQFAKFLLPEDGRAVWQVLATLTPKNPIVTSEHRSFNSHSGVRWQQWTDQAIFDQAGRVIEYQSVGRDITELKRAEEAEREQRRFAEALSSTAALISSTLNLGEVLDRILSQMISLNPANSTEIMLIEDGIARIVRTRPNDPHYKRSILNDGLSVQATRNLREMAETGRTILITNVNDYAGWVETDVGGWIRSLVGAPIRLEGETTGFLAMSSDQEGAFSDSDAERLQAFANQAAIAIRNARLYDKVARYNTDLEALVKERTAELDLTEQRLRAILDGTGEGIIYTERDVIQYANFEFCRMTGYTADELVGQPYIRLNVSAPNHDPLDEVRRGMRINSIWRGELGIGAKTAASSPPG